MQFITYLSRLVRGDLGESYYNNASVVSLIGERFGASLLLSGTSAVLAFVLGTSLGLVAGQRTGGIADRTFSTGAYICNSMPSFWLGMMLILVFASKLGWLPTQGMYDMRAWRHRLRPGGGRGPAHGAAGGHPHPHPDPGLLPHHQVVGVPGAHRRLHHHLPASPA